MLGAGLVWPLAAVCRWASPHAPLPACLPPPRFPCPQTGQYSTQIFSLAVLLSSLFVFNQMGGIDEAALDRCGRGTLAGGSA